ncbi:hypothetical protein DQ04_01411050 [Trypanosoma grayi]|uniref:hypothetical protein n=1 Tax=Trypanosoma grayi TaxID=71804 RepID=UPI0004F4129B|nr:hypothetical protein DQ04_01411050 [Trypanosoma grayi]KEG12803.1 hypothetical protein DQ04_01411050 [Trypanosoma grayi]
MYCLWKCALNPLLSVALVLAVCLCLYFSSLETILVVCFTLGLCYYGVNPRAQTNSKLWRRLAQGRSQAVRLAETGLIAGTQPVVIVSFTECHTSWFDHALLYAQSDFRRFGAWACFCLVHPLTSSFRLPLTRLALWKMGGVLEYRRGVLIDMMTRRNLGVAVILHGSLRDCDAGRSTVRLQNKGMFGAFLRANALIIPAISTSDGRVIFGSALSPPCSGEVPTPVEVRNAVRQFSEELQRLHVKVFGSTLVVDD